jgi:hypothetical protein
MDRVFVGVLQFSVMHTISKRAASAKKVVSSTVYACMDARFKVSGSGTSDADDWLGGGIKMLAS